MSSSNKPTHEVESRADRRQQRELAAARQSGTVAPAVDAATGQMINPHNPEFITKRPWYLGGEDGAGGGGGGVAAGAEESLQHQTDQRPEQDRRELSLTSAEELVAQQRQKLKQLKKKGQFVQGQWVEALKKNKMPYRICQIVKIHKKGTEFDLQYEDGTVEERVKPGHPRAARPRIRMTAAGSRAALAQEAAAHDVGKETYDSKRDPYHGYDRDQHNALLQSKYERKLAVRRQLREQKQQEKKDSKDNDNNNNDNDGGAAASDSDFDDSDIEDSNNDDSDNDEFLQQDERVIATRLARQGGVGGAQMKITARNLRIREDTAKYLRNLDPNSAYYDPKSRSMRDNPHESAAADEVDFRGDNFSRISGDAVGLAQQQLFAWDAAARGVPEVHPQANPSQAELLKRQFQGRAETVQQQRQKAVLDRYGGAEYLDGQDGLAKAAAANLKATTDNDKNNNNNNDNNDDGDGDKKPAAIPDRQLRFGVTTEATEYTRDGRKIQANGTVEQRRAIPSKYQEDVYTNGHTTVWGSYFHKGAFAWGYADDHSLMKQSYCTGENGRRANDEANALQFGTGVQGSAELAQARGMLQQQQKRQEKEGASSSSNTNTIVGRSKLYGEADPHAKLDPAKVREALKRQQQQQQQDELNTSGSKRRKYHSMEADNVDMTEEQMEAYRLGKEQKSDPMAKLAGSDELLEYKK